MVTGHGLRLSSSQAPEGNDVTAPKQLIVTSKEIQKM